MEIIGGIAMDMSSGNTGRTAILFSSRRETLIDNSFGPKKSPLPCFGQKTGKWALFRQYLIFVGPIIRRPLDTQNSLHQKSDSVKRYFPGKSEEGHLTALRQIAQCAGLPQQIHHRLGNLARETTSSAERNSPSAAASMMLRAAFSPNPLRAVKGRRILPSSQRYLVAWDL